MKVSGTERAVIFRCEGETLLGVLHAPVQPVGGLGVVIVVGGPQYRVGSHRQFVTMARTLAASGFPVLRFDCRGMGDGGGIKPSFDQIGPDIAAAVEALCWEAEIESCVIYGLCDAASAAMMSSCVDHRIAGLMLANPWVRDEAVPVATMVRHYYLQRLLSVDFWRKALSGKFRIIQTLRDLLGFAASGRQKSTAKVRGILPYQQRMLQGLASFHGRVQLILSGQDLVAREFESLVGRSSDWSQLVNGDRVKIDRIGDADHTFSRRESFRTVLDLHVNWLIDLLEKLARN